MAKFIKFDKLDLNSTKAAAAIVKVLGHFFRGPVDKCPPDSVECLAAVVAIAASAEDSDEHVAAFASKFAERVVYLTAEVRRQAAEQNPERN